MYEKHKKYEKYKNIFKRLTMDQQVNVILAIDKLHTTPQSQALQTRLSWVKPSLWAQPSHSLCLEYLWHIHQHE